MNPEENLNSENIVIDEKTGEVEFKSIKYKWIINEDGKFYVMEYKDGSLIRTEF